MALISKKYNETNVWHSINPDICTGNRKTKYKLLGITVYTRHVEYSNDVTSLTNIDTGSNSGVGFKPAR